jgi:hypothetical protein
MNYRTSIGLDVHARSIREAAFAPKTGDVIEGASAMNRPPSQNRSTDYPNRIVLYMKATQQVLIS